MDLPIFRKDQPQPEHFWSLAIGKNWVDSAVWRVVGNKTEIVVRGGILPYQEDDVMSLIEAADGSLSNAASVLHEEAGEPSKVVFGLPSFYLNEGEIKKEYVDVLKKLSKELDLSPAGFVIIPEALVHYLKIKEGAPPNAILVGVTEDVLEISLVQTGKILGTTEVGRSVSIGSDISEGLARLPKSSQYPTRFLLYEHERIRPYDHHASSLDQIKHQLLENDWESLNITFLHTPKVEILAEDVVISAVSLAGGAEVGNATTLEGLAAVSAEEEMPEVMDETMAEQANESLETENPPGEEHDNIKTVRPEELGFVEGTTPPSAAEQVAPRPTFATNDTIPTYTPPPVPLGALPKKLPKFNLPKFNLPRLRHGQPVLMLLVSFLLLAALGWSYWYLPKAKISVFVSPKNFDQQIEFGINKTQNIDTNAKTIPGRYIEVEKTVQKTKDTTGAKKVGDKAQGQVIINRVGPSVTIPKGTVFISGNLKFTLDKDVKVASGSGLSDIGHNTEAAALSASDIGTDYNLPASSSFKVGTYPTSTTDAKNDKAFTGGTSREVASVAAVDLTDLETQAKEELKNQSLQDAQNQLSSSEILIPDDSGLAVSKKEFSGKSGDEARTLSITLTGKVKILVVSKEVIAKYLESQTQLPDGFTLQADQIKLTPKGAENGIYQVDVHANLLPKVNPQDIVAKVAGKSAKEAKLILSNTPGFTRVVISTKFKFPIIGGLPHIMRNISVEVVADK